MKSVYRAVRIGSSNKTFWASSLQVKETKHISQHHGTWYGHDELWRYGKAEVGVLLKW